jgi:hypothetical protein
MSGIGVNATDMAVLGPNAVNASVRNVGVTSQTGLPLTLEYSTDGGATWPASESFTPSALGPGQAQTFTFSQAWLINFSVVRSLRVRMNPQVSSLRPVATRTYVPDVDVVSVGVTAGVAPLAGPNTVTMTLRNMGRFGLNGMPLTLQYSANNGQSTGLQVVTPTALAAYGSSETFSFSTPWMIPGPRAGWLIGSLATKPSGDPDATDSALQTYAEAGASGAAVSHIQGSGGGYAIPFSSSYTNAKLQTYWRPDQLNNLSGEVAEFGVPFSAAVDTTFPYVRIELGECQHTIAPFSSSTLGASYSANYNVPSAPRKTVYEGPLTVKTTTVNQVWRVPIQVSFVYSGQYDLLATFYVVGSTAAANIASDTQSPNTSTSRLTATNAGDVLTGTTFSSPVGYNVSILFRPLQTGAVAQLDAVAAGSGLAAAGSNLVSVTIRSAGSVPLTAPLTVQYSTDGGLSWPAAQSQTFTIPSLAPGQTQVVTFSTPWMIGGVGPVSLAARINPPSGTLDQFKAAPFTPDIDITDVGTTPPTPLPGPNTVAFTLRNNGTFSLNGAALNVCYTTDSGVTLLSGTFVPTQLGGAGSSQTFTFAAPWVLAAAGAGTLAVGLLPSVTGDPDPYDSLVRQYPNAGQPTVNATFDPNLNTPLGGNTIPFATTQSKYQTNYTPTMLGNNYGTITEFGVMFGGAISTRTWPSVRIEMGETTASTSSFSLEFDANYNVPSAPKATVFSGPLTVATTAPYQVWRVPMTTPFFYSGANNLLVTIYVNGATSPSGGGNVFTTTNGPAVQAFRVYANGVGDALVATASTTSFGTGAFFRFAGVGPSNALALTGIGLAGSVPMWEPTA